MHDNPSTTNDVIESEQKTSLDPNIMKYTFPTSPWLQLLSNCHRPKLRLYCFPYAGGNGGIFSKWPAALGEDIEVCAISLPGRRQRSKEDSIACIHTLSWEIAEAIRQESYRPFVFFGHSMGAILANEVAQELRKQGAMLPEHFFVSGSPAPSSFRKNESRHRKKVACMDKEELMDYLQKLSGTPSALLQDNEMLEHIMMTMMPDLEAMDLWQYQPSKPFKQSISVFIGKEDSLVDYSSAILWQQHTEGSCNVHTIPGNHFFINTHMNIVTNKIKRTLEFENLI